MLVILGEQVYRKLLKTLHDNIVCCSCTIETILSDTLDTISRTKSLLKSIQRFKYMYNTEKHTFFFVRAYI